ncbi:MAG: hypothetical protein NW223_21970 [Hyphomicrobiaceae bacterium]|nr:hypothetical protein [Hyphomicrobiaceae bacterium]
MRAIRLAIAALLAGWLLADAAAAQQRPSLSPFAPAPDLSSGPVKIDLSRSRDLDNWLAVQAELRRRRLRPPASEGEHEETERLQQLDRQYSARWFPRDRTQATYHGLCLVKMVDDCLTCEIRPNIYLEVAPEAVSVGQVFRFQTTRRAEFLVYPDGVEFAIQPGSRFEMLVGGYVEMERIK